MACADAADEIRQIARTWAPDHYLSALLAPRTIRADLIAIAAFLGDVERIIATVPDPTLAEIRLQWWRDVMASAQRGDRSGSPLADACGEALRRHALPFAAFDEMLDARAFDLYADPLLDGAALNVYLAKADGAPFQLAAHIHGVAAPEASPLIAHAAQAYGHARLLRTTAAFVARGRAPFPARAAPAETALSAVELAAVELDLARDTLSRARAAWRGASANERAACLPVAVVGPYLRATQQQGFDSKRMIANIQPLTRAWHLWRAHATGRW